MRRYVLYNAIEVLVFFGMELKPFTAMLTNNVCYFFEVYGTKKNV